MPKENTIKIRKTGRGSRLMIWSGGRWHSVALETKRHFNDKVKPHMLTNRTKNIRDNSYLLPETVVGGAAPPGVAQPLSLTTTVSFIYTTASKNYFTLDMGYAGQMKIIVNTSITTSHYPTIEMKTMYGDNQTFHTTLKGKGLMLICDGTYWHPIGQIDSDDDDFPGYWKANIS